MRISDWSSDVCSSDLLRALFLGFITRAKIAVLNLDDAETALLAARLPAEQVLSYGFGSRDADLFGSDIREAPLAVRFDVTERATGKSATVRLGVPGRPNAATALAALCAADRRGRG